MKVYEQSLNVKLVCSFSCCSYSVKQYKRYFCMFAYPDINMIDIRRMLENYVSPQLCHGFAELARILPILCHAYIMICKQWKCFLLQLKVHLSTNISLFSFSKHTCIPLFPLLLSLRTWPSQNGHGSVSASMYVNKDLLWCKSVWHRTRK